MQRNSILSSTITGLLLLALLSSVRAPGMGLPDIPGTPAAPDPRPSVPLAPDQAIAVALNDLQATADGYRLRHPRHLVRFTPDGLQFTPRRGGPQWAWQLTFVGAGDTPFDQAYGKPLAGPALNGMKGLVGRTRPVNPKPRVVAYARGALVEQYLAKKDALEQQFVIPQPLELTGADLAIAGAVHSSGAFMVTGDGWAWRTDEGEVRLGAVRAYDAAGRTLPATMTATASTTRIVVDGAALIGATYPVTIDPEIGANDFRLSDMGLDAWYDASSAAVAYNADDEYLVVWWGDDNTGGLADNEGEIFGQRVDAATGAEIGGDIRLSDMGPGGDSDYDAFSPAVAYNSAEDEYLVVWYGDDNTGALVDNEYEIYGQRVNAETGVQVGANDFRISDMGPDGDASYSARDPAVAYNPTNNEYLVVWSGDDDTATLVDGEYDIFSQRIDATGAQVGTNDFRLSSMGPDGDAAYDASDPAVAYNSRDNEYLVVWAGDDNTAPLANGETEIFGQRMDAASGAQVGTNDFRINDMGPDGDAAYDASDPAVAYNSRDNEYLVVWHGNDGVAPLARYEREIYGQRVDAASGAQVGTNDFRISDMGPEGDHRYGALFPAVAYSSADNEYLVVWEGSDDAAPLVSNEWEVFGQRLSAAGAQVGANDFRLSDVGPDGDEDYDASESAVTYNSTSGEYLAVWEGDDTIPLMNDAYEIFGQRFLPAFRLYLPAVLR